MPFEGHGDVTNDGYHAILTANQLKFRAGAEKVILEQIRFSFWASLMPITTTIFPMGGRVLYYSYFLLFLLFMLFLIKI